jgi:hypothetical protein
VLDTDGFVELSSEIASRESVQERLAVRIADASFQALDVEDLLASILADVRPAIAFLAGPLTTL